MVLIEFSARLGDVSKHLMYAMGAITALVAVTNLTVSKHQH